jgi:hypothetical protein
MTDEEIIMKFIKMELNLGSMYKGDYFELYKELHRRGLVVTTMRLFYVLYPEHVFINGSMLWLMHELRGLEQ